MGNMSKALTPEQKMKLYRARMRKAGLRPVQIWVPDIRSPALVKEVRRQSRLASRGPDEKAALAFIEATGAWDD
jgi:hypothetical protein